ncbi:S-adenosyl-L-methionine-dependent methyltransferase [Umbelopsis sp. PMI_123]|nr:S-adenosyl-L-methionine-dependent methyltransferase [Umbelopsis sp. PMI_123]
MSTLRVLEFYSGIGGMHFAAEEAGWDYKIIKAFDINTTANEVYAFNHGKSFIAQRNIEALSLEFYDAQKADVWTMSPPCQPHTRTGLKLDSKDPRSKSFLYLMNMLPKMKHPPKYILVENVKGFDESDSRYILIQQLEECNYTYQEFLLNPLQMGIPNSRLRYYLLAKAQPLTFAMEPTGTIIGYVPSSQYLATEFKDERGAIIKDEETILKSEKVTRRYIHEFLSDHGNVAHYNVPDKVLLKHGHAFDIVKPSSSRSCCFTKGYYHYVEATGSILQMNEDGDTDGTFNQIQQWKDSAREPGTSAEEQDQQKVLTSLHTLQLRYFSPREVGNLMGFPTTFGFPETMSLKQKYRTLGNSINVLVVAELMKYLIKEGSNMEPATKMRKLD